MDTELLSRELRAAVETVAPRPGFADVVIDGGGRRLVRRRRFAVAAVVIAVAAATTGGAALLSRRAVDGPPAAPPDWLTVPTGGDLAGDRAFLAAAMTAWQAALPASPNAGRYAGRTLGEARVYWAGSTPAGPTAMVIQRVGSTDAAIGLYNGGRIVTDLPPVLGPAGVAFLFGDGDRTMLVMDAGRPLLASGGVRRDQDGRVTRDWQPLTVADGVALHQWPPGTDVSAVRVALAVRPGEPDRGAPILTLLASRYADGFDRQSKYRAEHRLDWEGTITLRGPKPVVTVSGIEPYLESAGMLDPYLRIGAPGRWHIAATLPDGRTAWVTEYQQDSAPSRLYAEIGDGWRVLDGGPIDPAAPLPVKIRLPDYQGWVVAAFGSRLRYRMSVDGSWNEVGTAAALIPDAPGAVIAVEVTPPAGTPTVIQLGS